MRNTNYSKGLSTAASIGLVFVLIILAGGVYYTLKQYSNLPQATNSDTDMGPDMMTRSVRVTLNAQNASGETGTAELEDIGNGTKVTIRLAGAPSGVPQPAHIHVGSCPNPGAVTYPLPNVVNGESTATISTSLNDLLEELPLAINVHKSGTDLATYVSCGDIKSGSSPMDSEGTMNNENGGMMGQSPVKTFTITAQNFSFSQSEIRVKKGDTVKIHFSSAGGFHDWVLDEFNAKAPRVSEGQSADIEFQATKTGTFEYYCSVGTHRQMGMVGKLIVE